MSERPATCPLCDRTLLVEEGSAGYPYAFCLEHKIVADLDPLTFEPTWEPWVVMATARKMMKGRS